MEPHQWGLSCSFERYTLTDWIQHNLSEEGGREKERGRNVPTCSDNWSHLNRGRYFIVHTSSCHLSDFLPPKRWTCGEREISYKRREKEESEEDKISRQLLPSRFEEEWVRLTYVLSIQHICYRSRHSFIHEFNPPFFEIMTLMSLFLFEPLFQAHLCLISLSTSAFKLYLESVERGRKLTFTWICSREINSSYFSKLREEMFYFSRTHSRWYTR